MIVAACRALVVALFCLSGPCCLSSEPEEVATSINVTSGMAFAGEEARLTQLDARAELNPHVTFSTGLAYLELDHGYNELQARLLATATIPMGRWILEDRSIVSLSSQSVERYRNRLRVTRPGFLGFPPLSAHAYDEFYFDFDRGRVIRNTLALGLSAAMGTRWRGELYHVWVDNRGARGSNYVLAIISWRLAL